MDIQRYALITVSALLALMLLSEWTQFSAQQKAINSANVPMVSPSSTPANPLAFENGEKIAAPSLNSSDLPPASDEDIPPTANVNEGSPNNRASLVEVETQTLRVMIDLNGGDIVGVALKEYPKTLEDGSDPFVLLERNATRTYIAQSGLVGINGIDQASRAKYSAQQQLFVQREGEPLDVVLRHISDNPDVKIEKVFSFLPNSHLISVKFEIQNDTSSKLRVTPFAQLKRDGSPAPTSNDSGMGMKPFVGAALTQPEKHFSKFSFEDIAEDPFQADLNGGWVAMLQHYFVSAWVPPANQVHRYRTWMVRDDHYIAGYTSPYATIEPGSRKTLVNKLYVGPKNQRVLADLAPHLDLVVDYGWLWWIAQPLFWLLTLIQSFVINWGVAIIVLTFLVKLAFFQLSAASYRSMARMRKVQPRIMAIREEYANDKAKQSQEMMELYKKEKINPLGGCLPILIQMPVFIALYWVLMESVELRQAPFALWIKDLSAMDPYFVLPLLMGASMYYMQKLNPAPPDPMQAKIMQWLPIVFTFFFLWFPAGLVLYWLCNNLLSMAQQYVINKRIEGSV